jgi:hypothetical protein
VGSIERDGPAAASKAAGDRWILDTAYSTWLAIPLARADLIVALDYPRFVSLARLVGRLRGSCGQLVVPGPQPQPQPALALVQFA